MKLANIGLDPEFILMKNQVVISALTATKGRKGSEIPLPKGAMLADNVLIEFNVNPSKSVRTLSNNFRTVLRESLSRLDGSLHAIPGINFPMDIIKSDPEALKFGCSPDFSGYDGQKNRIPTSASQESFRTTGGHVHIGANDESNEHILSDFGRMKLVRTLDLLLGVPFVFIEKDDSSPSRRKLYGLAGSYRKTDYGVEYRTLSSYWLRNPELFDLVFKMTQVGLKDISGMITSRIYSEVPPTYVQEIINESKKKECKELFNLIAELIPAKMAEKVISLSERSEPNSDVAKGWLND